MRSARILLCAFAGALGSEACAGELAAHHAYLDIPVKDNCDGHVRKGVRLG